MAGGNRMDLRQQVLLKNLTTTAIGQKLVIATMIQAPYEIDPHTTLNEKLKINNSATARVTADQYPKIRYYCIGNGGHQLDPSTTVPTFRLLTHDSTDGAPFRIIPFVLREPDNDLPAEMVQRYALRKTVQFDGVTMIAYYLRRIDTAQTHVEMKLANIENGEKHREPFVPSVQNLNPTPQPISPTGVNVTDSQYVEVFAYLTASFDEHDAEELRNVANIMYNDEQQAIISEIGLCSGIDYPVRVNTPGVGPRAVNEALAVQMTNIFTTALSAYNLVNGWDMVFRLGNGLPRHLTKAINTGDRT